MSEINDEMSMLNPGHDWNSPVVLNAGKVVGVIAIGDVVTEIIRELELNVGDLTGFIMRDGPGG